MKTRTQKGYIFKKGGVWYVRFYQPEMQPDGTIKRVPRAKPLAPVCADYKTKKSVEPLRDELFARLKLNSAKYNLQSTMTISQFAWGYYFPGYVADLKPSVRQPYECNWKKHLEPLCGNIRLRDFRTVTGQQMIVKVAGEGIGRNTARRLKSLLSGIFSEAIRQGALDGSNPMREVRIPTRHLPPPKQTHAYGLGEIKKMLKFFDEPVRTVIGLASYAGLRKGELAGVRVEDWRDGDVWVEQSVWRKYITEPKSRKSKAPVPVITPLRQLLEEHCKGRTEGLMFQSRKGTPLNLDNLARNIIRPGLAQIGLKWYGWHAFRRGLATNLKQIGVDDKTIQTILRHADYTTTMNHYVLSVPESVRTAMKRFEMFVCNQYATETKAKIA